MQRLRLKSDKPSRIVEDDVVPCALYDYILVFDAILPRREC